MQIENTTFDFGPHKNIPLKDISDDYLFWVCYNSVETITISQRRYIEERLSNSKLIAK